MTSYTLHKKTGKVLKINFTKKSSYNLNAKSFQIGTYWHNSGKKWSNGVIKNTYPNNRSNSHVKNDHYYFNYTTYKFNCNAGQIFENVTGSWQIFENFENDIYENNKYDHVELNCYVSELLSASYVCT